MTKGKIDKIFKSNNTLKICLYTLFLVFISCQQTKTLTTKGLIFNNCRSDRGCCIDSVSVSCEEWDQANKEYKKTIRKCNPQWLIQKDYNGNKKFEGYAVRFGYRSRHHIFFGELITYNESGDTLSHYKDTTFNLKKVLRWHPIRIRRFLRNGEYVYDNEQYAIGVFYGLSD